MRAQQITKTVGTVSTPILPANPKRITLLFSGDGTNTITISFGSSAVAGAGLVLTPTNPHARLDVADVGELLWSPIECIASAAGATLTVFEGFE
jgi:hypothetical protein